MRRLLLILLAGFALRSGQNQRSGRVTDDDGRAFEINTGGIADTLAATITGAAPGAGVVIGAITVPPAGVYRVSGIILLTGTAEVAVKNLRLSHAAAITDLPSISGMAVPFTLERVTCNGVNSLNFLTIAAATAGSIYTIYATATRVE